MDKSNTKTLIAVVGPTASGKTPLGIELANELNTVVISADSRQFYKEMAIGTAKPTPDELAQAQHYFVDSHSIQDNFNVGSFEQEGLKLLDELFKTHDVVVMVGGSGLYVKAITEGFDDLPNVDPVVRERLNMELIARGIEYLQEKLKAADPIYYDQVDLHNPQRIIRALEVSESTGQPFSSFRKSAQKKRDFNVFKLGVSMPRDVLYNRINMRADMMVQQGLIDEVKALLPYRHLNALQTVGYTEIFDYLDGVTDLPTAIELIKQNTRRFAKRQMTWFNRDKEIYWMPPAEMVDFVKSRLA